LKVKVCGITRLEDALLAEQLGADAIGFIFYKMSKRYITPEQAGIISEALSAFALRVGVFVNANPEEIKSIAAVSKINVVQLHGEELSETLEQINLPTVKSFRVSENFDFSILEKYACSTFLLDTFSEKGYGGTGKTFNWGIIPEEVRSRVLIAGGVSDRNVENIFKQIHPYGVDLSSSLESSPGIKDHNKMKQFFNKINQLRSTSC